jgi:hypothetical protein
MVARESATGHSYRKRSFACPPASIGQTVIFGHGVSLLRWRSGGVKHLHDMPPFRFSPSPTLGDSPSNDPFCRCNALEAQNVATPSRWPGAPMLLQVILSGSKRPERKRCSIAIGVMSGGLKRENLHMWKLALIS